MQNLKDVMTQAADGFIKCLADELGVSLTRMYELLAKDNPYPKLWRILRPLGRCNPDRLRLVQADFNARVAAVLGETSHVSDAVMHKELSDVIQAALERKDPAEQAAEIREAVAVLNSRLAALEGNRHVN